MCYFIFAETSNTINEEVIERNEQSSLYVQNLSYLVEIKDKNLYHISNGHCACDIAVSPHRLIDNVKDVLKNIEGNFNFIIIDSEKDDVEPLLEENKDFESFLSKFETVEINFNEFISKYPNQIKFDTLYKIKR
ncbi:hypothetical protein [Caloramator proteoclasticus]|uniref:Uncharacterized protein n=1 Tax=Caloramator proteoclasticus DSM 10124 TaxID=1121262 RepID=A0A1M4XZU6_9CLOT|nr:hypothetical protein [Caloramator proteoclasticus]SHE98965.1 hypothetical protein SAMN02746091_01544 [Caloramator proteoclasticus DSM 10124]